MKKELVMVSKTSPYKMNGTFSHKTFTVDHFPLTCSKHGRFVPGKVIPLSKESKESKHEIKNLKKLVRRNAAKEWR